MQQYLKPTKQHLYQSWKLSKSQLIYLCHGLKKKLVTTKAFSRQLWWHIYAQCHGIYFPHSKYITSNWRIVIVSYFIYLGMLSAEKEAINRYGWEDADVSWMPQYAT